MQKLHRNGFTLLELIFVIVILGIVASIGSELIAKTYYHYIIQRAQHRASLKTELAALQIANRLAAAVPGTVIRRLETNGSIEGINDPMLLDTTGDTYTVLQWVGADMDSFNYYDDGSKKVGWSGFCDVEGSDKTHILTLGSSLNFTNTIIENLSKNSAGIATKHLSNAALYFPYDMTEHNLSAATSIAVGENNITLSTAIAHIVEHYKLAWTSYALVVESNAEGGKDLKLYYNFPPIPGTNVAGSSSLLMKNISTFKFKGTGQTIRFKICKQENIGEDFNITSCKEKVVF